MTQTSAISQASFNEKYKDVKLKSSLKRKETDDMMKESKQQCKKQATTVRSRINADKNLWDTLTLLKPDVRTSGVIPRLEPNFQKGDTMVAYLCSPLTDHLSTGFMDLGWGCGYRNCQMLMSYLERQEEDGEPILKNVLDISSIQLLIEKAWKEGFDSLGAAQLEHHVYKTRKWIGTTEVYTLLAYLGIRSSIIDFHQPGPTKLHSQMLDWIQSYFHVNTNKTVYITNRPPLYLQHQGHSRTVIGIELLKSGKRNLIMFDPGRRILRSYKKHKNKNKQQQQQDVHSNSDDTNTEEEEEEIDIMTDDSNSKKDNNIRKRFLAKLKPLPSSLLRPFRVDDKSIAKNKQYQILVLGQLDYNHGKMTYDSAKSFLLSEQERESMKNVTSFTVL